MNSIYSTFQKIYALLFGFPFFVRFNEAIITFCLRAIGINNYENGKISGEDAFLREIVGGIDKPIIVDVGAHFGEYAELVHKINSNAVIHSFEPNLHSYKILRARKLKGKFQCYQIALGDREKVAYLYDGASHEGSQFASLYPDVIRSIHKLKTSKTKIKVSTLDKWSKALTKDMKIDLLKIDVEGNELAVLKGATNLIKNNRIRHIQFEFNTMNILSRVFLSDIKNALADYKLYRLLPHGKIEIKDSSILMGEIFAFQNIVAIHK